MDIIIPEDKIDDFTNTHCTWNIDGEEYKYLESYLVSGDGECTQVIVQRKSDERYFAFTWLLSRSENYHYNEYWREVSPKVVSKTVWERVGV